MKVLARITTVILIAIGTIAGFLISELLHVSVENLSELLSSIAEILWPIALLVVFLTYKEDIRSLIPRVKKANIFGSELEIGSLSADEIHEKAKQEVLEIKTTDELTTADEVQVETTDWENIATPNFALEEKSYLKLIPEIESKALDRYESSLQGFEMKRQVKISDSKFDAYAVNKKGRPYLIEVKVFPDVIDKQGRIRMLQVLTRINLWLADISTRSGELIKKNFRGQHPVVVLILVFNTNLDLKKVMHKIDKIKEKFNNSPSPFSVKFICYNIDKIGEFVEKVQ